MKIQTKYPTVFIDIDTIRLSYKIIQVIEGKNKIRRRVVGRAIKKSTKGNPKCDTYGNQLYVKFNNFDDAKQHASNFVDNFLILI